MVGAFKVKVPCTELQRRLWQTGEIRVCTQTRRDALARLVSQRDMGAEMSCLRPECPAWPRRGTASLPLCWTRSVARTWQWLPRHSRRATMRCHARQVALAYWAGSSGHAADFAWRGSQRATSRTNRTEARLPPCLLSGSRTGCHPDAPRKSILQMQAPSSGRTSSRSHSVSRWIICSPTRKAAGAGR